MSKKPVKQKVAVQKAKKVWGQGPIKIGDIELDCYILEDGTTVLNKGKMMRYSDHGNRNAEYGWEIDHINPVSNGGADVINNLQPLHWKNNAAKGDKLDWNCN